jgi:hypothetical protein
VAAVAASSLVPIIAAAKVLRETGGAVVGEVAITAQKGAAAVVLASWRQYPVMTFRVGGEAVADDQTPELDAPASARPRGRKG